ncbi:helix-turn-helix domain-containing protein, partial [Enterococcus faecalis]
GLTMQEFGHKVSNSPRSTVSTWEHGGNLPSKEKMSQIAKLGQVNEDWLKWGDFEEYINEYISFLGYTNYISNRQHIADIISKDI